MIITQKKAANAIGGKTARACESCLKRRAIWFCAADDAFLCHACDMSVHSANGLASQHHRLCLDTSLKPTQHQHQQSPSWHHGFTKKARTPRKNTNNKATINKDTCKYNPQMMFVVPEVSNDDEYEVDGVLMLVDEENTNYKESINDDSQMIFSVPNLDDDDDISKGYKEESVFGIENYNNDGELFNFSLLDFEGDVYDNHDVHGWEFPENELAELAADVESLLEQEEDEEGVATKGMKHEQEGEVISANDCHHTSYFGWSIDVESEMFTFNLNDNCEENDEHNKSHHHHHYYYHHLLNGEEKEEGYNGNVMVPIKDEEVEESNNSIEDGSMEASNKKRKIVLRLNYDDVINAWASQGCSSPWTTGRRPEFGFDHHGWPYCMGDLRPPGVERRVNAKGRDGGREARVSRYREKKRTRLFSKKIRYEVRKLNAEKRPRLKGRFVKRASLSQGVGAESAFPYPNN